MNYVPQSKKGNNKAKQTSKKLPHCRPEDRSKQKSCSVTPKKSKVSVTCFKIFHWLYCLLPPPPPQHLTH